MDPQAIIAKVKAYAATLSTSSLILGVAAGFFLAPVITFLLFTVLLPLAIFLVVVIAALVVYLVKKKGAQKRDAKMMVAALPYRLDNIYHTWKNTLTDAFWYSTYNKTEKDKVCLVQAETGEQFSYYDVEAFSNRVAQWALDETVTSGDNVALYVGNCLEYFPFWLGISKIGARAALINFNLTQKALAHCITAVTNPRGVIFDADHAAAIDQIRGELPADVKLWYYGAPEDAPEWAISIKDHLSSLPPTQVEERYRSKAAGTKVSDPVVYVYTSGTTGLPKAAVISHVRLRTICAAFPNFGHYKKEDVMYCVLPLYHSAGGLCALGSILWSGSTMIIRGRFSASAFSRDCRKYNVTLFQYIGQICRYLANAPDSPDDKLLNIRVAVGNGMRPDVWPRFVKKFRIKQVLEFYGATEGPGALINTENKEGAIGFGSPVLQMLVPQLIVKYDRNEDKEIRGADGFCIEAGPGEPGHFISKIKKTFGASNYNGYTNKAASDKKILRDVFKKGDAWFGSGDLLRQEADGFVYFVDRIGDTFRWKGENCSTNEVSAVLGSMDEIPDLNVYGVEVKNNDGRAGMAAIIGADVDGFPFEKVAAKLRDELPAYARPLFYRFMPEADITSTFKHKKITFQKEGFDPNVIKEPLYFFDGKAFHKLDAELYEKIQSGAQRV